MKKFPVWLDCDVGVDDAIAIMTAHALSEIDLLAISTVSGNAPLSATFPNAHRMNGLMKTHYPVYKGADRPLLVEPQYAAAFHGENGLGDVELPLPEDAVMNVTPAWDALYDRAKQHPGELRLIAVGPLTNVAIALTKYPDLKTLLHTILIMGGAASGGNVTPAAEFNIYADPDAAQIVFKSGVPIVMCGLDVTLQAVLTPEDWDELAATGHARRRLHKGVSAKGVVVLTAHRLCGRRNARYLPGDVSGAPGAVPRGGSGRVCGNARLDHTRQNRDRPLQRQAVRDQKRAGGPRRRP